MSAMSTPDPKQVLARLKWVKAGRPGEDADPVNWKNAAEELFDTLETTCERLDAAGLCRKCGRPLGSYCVQCAWPSGRHQRGQNDN